MLSEHDPVENVLPIKYQLSTFFSIDKLGSILFYKCAVYLVTHDLFTKLRNGLQRALFINSVLWIQVDF